MRDRLVRACRQEPVDATPVWFMRQAGRALPEFRAIRERATLADIVADPALCVDVTLQPVRRLGVDGAVLFADITTPVAGIGVPVQIVTGVGPVIASPIRSDADVEALHPFEPEEAVGPLLQAIRILARESPVPLIGFAGAPFTLACYLIEGGPSRDFIATKRLMHEAPERFARLMERLSAMTTHYLAAQVAAGVQVVQLFDSWVGGLSPYDYREHVLPHMRQVFQEVRTLGVPSIHFGTATGGLLRLMAEAGGDVIGLDWRISLTDGWAEVPDRGIQGNLDPAALLGPFEETQRQVRWILGQADGRSGHVFNLGHGVHPDSDPDALRRVVDLVHEVTSRAGPVPAASGPSR
ncbi:MAG: uroporphyrinogen decarboxylase [Candidatus Limnocylindrales bacterium]